MKTLKLNDKVQVISGAHKGETATIVAIDRENNKAMLENIGTRERHLKKSYYNPMGSKKTVHLGIDMSNLKLVEAYDYKKAAKKAEKKGAK